MMTPESIINYTISTPLTEGGGCGDSSLVLLRDLLEDGYHHQQPHIYSLKILSTGVRVFIRIFIIGVKGC